MTETLAHRMTEMENYLREELRPKPKKWYQETTDNYTSTKLLARENRKPLPVSPVIFKYDLRRALLVTCLFLVMAGIAFLIFRSFESLFCFLAMVGIFSLPDTIRAFNQKDIVVINEHGISANEIFIKWQHLLPSYIKEKNIGDDNTEYLLTLFFYDEEKDEFDDLDISLSGLKGSPAFISALLEHFRFLALAK